MSQTLEKSRKPMILNYLSWVFNEKSWIFTIIQGFWGNLGVNLHHHP